MTSTRILGHVLTLFAVGLLSSGPRAARADEARRPPNVVFLLADDLGWTDLGCFGSDLYETPHIDRLAAGAMKFTDAYSACTVCSPTRASIMTGMYPARLHLTDFIAGQNRPYARMRIPDWTKFLEHKYVTLAEALHSAGYATAQVGKWHLNRPGAAGGYAPIDHGFDRQVDKPAGTTGYFLKEGSPAAEAAGSTYLTDYLTHEAVQTIEEWQDRPFFLYFAYHVPHTPIEGRADLVEHFRGKVREDALHRNPEYAAMVASLDQSVGRVLDTLERLGLDDNTLVIFTSDNGGLTQRYGVHDNFTENIALRRGKGSAYEGGVRVPAIVRWPGVTQPGQVCDEPVMTIDYYPTILEVSGAAGDAPHNAGIDGRSLVPLLRDPSASIDRQLYWHYPHYHAGGDSPYSAVRAGSWRLIEFHEDDSIRLYNLADDLGETTDLAEKQPDVARRLRADLHAWRDEVNAQLPTPNPDYDPARETEVGGGGRRRQRSGTN